MGGSIATLFAASRPDAVRRLVLVEGTGPPDDRSMALHRARKHLVDRRNVPVHRSMPDLAHAASRLLRWNSRLNDQSASRLAARCTEPHPDGGLRWSWDPRHRWRNPRPIDGGAFQQYLSGVTAPTLVVVGAESAFRMPDDDARRSALRTPTLLELPGAGHMVHHDQPATLARAIRAHLA
jgi:pimeloyl-ACP methyl ester carboxylesterase